MPEHSTGESHPASGGTEGASHGVESSRTRTAASRSAQGLGGQYFYFVHSYYAEPADSSIVAGWTDYGVRFPSIVAKDNLIATQFHPEKSGEIGLSIYAGFIEWASNLSR